MTVAQKIIQINFLIEDLPVFFRKNQPRIPLPLSAIMKLVLSTDIVVLCCVRCEKNKTSFLRLALLTRVNDYFHMFPIA